MHEVVVVAVAVVLVVGGACVVSWEENPKTTILIACSIYIFKGIHIIGFEQFQSIVRARPKLKYTALR